MSAVPGYNDDALYAAQYAALDAEVGAACLALAPQLGGTGVALGDLDELCVALRRPVRDDRERVQLMATLDPENAMRIDRAAVTAWLLEELLVVSQSPPLEPPVPYYVRATPVWEEMVEPPPCGDAGPPSVYYFNATTGETAWALAHPFATCLYRHVQDAAEIRALKAPRDADGFLVLSSHDSEMVDDLQRVFAKFDDDRDGRLDANEFRDLCVALSFPLGLADGSNELLTETMRAVDPHGDRDLTISVSWDAMLDFWTAHAPWQRHTRFAITPYEQWERLERLDRRTQAQWFRHTTTLRERWTPPNADHVVVDLVTKLFPSSKLEWRQRVDMLWLQLRQTQPSSPDTALPAVWTLRECRALLDQLGWDFFTRREHVVSFLENLQRQYGGGEDPTVLTKETLAAWIMDCVARVEMDGWEECVDESSGQRYYYHEALGLTQWDPPQLENRMAKMMARFSGDGGALTRDDQIKRIFRHYDEDESGSISFHEFKRLYVALLGHKEAVTGDSAADDAQIQQVFSVLDTSGDDEVSLDEFMVWWKTKLNIEDEETEQQRLARVACERRRIAVEFLKHHGALIVRPIDGTKSVDQEAIAVGDEDSEGNTYLFESNILGRLVGVLGKYPLKGIAYRDALTQLVHVTRLVDQEIVLEDFLAWYVTFEEREKEKEELAEQKARALALLQAKEAEAKEKARKLKMIRKGQLITKAIASDDVTKGGSAPEPAEVIWRRHVETLFRKFDKDNSGFLDAGELKALTHALGHALDDAQVKQMMAVMDSSGDERISVDEFVTFWTAFQRRKYAKQSNSPTKKTVAKAATDEPSHRREAISMVDASANLAVNLELAKERVLKLTVNDVTDALGDWKESLLDRSRKKKLAKELAEQQRARLEALKKEWAAFVPTKKARYAHLDVTWIEPEVVRCMVDMIEVVRARARPLPREDAAQRIQRIVRGVVTRMRLFAMVLARFPVHVDLDTGFFYYVDMEDRGRVWLHRPLFHTITSPVAPWDLADCKTKVERLRFRHRQLEMQAKQRFYHKFIRDVTASDVVHDQRNTGPLFVPASFVMFTVLDQVRTRMLDNIWHALRDRSFVLAELMARRHWRQLTVRSNSDASAPLPLHHVVKHHRHTPFRLIQAIYEGHADAVRERDAYGRTPLHLALRERAGFRVVDLLLSRPSRLIEAPTRSTPTPTSVWVMQSFSGETPLHVALRYGVSLELLRWMCRHKSLLGVPHHAAVTIQNRHGLGVFHLVVATLFDADHAAYWRSVVLVLLKTWPRRELCSEASGSGDLPLHLAIERYIAVLHERATTKTSRPNYDEDQSWLWVIRLLITEYPDALLVRRKHDSLLAVHLLMRGAHVPETLVLETLRATIRQWQAKTTQGHDDTDTGRLVQWLMLSETKTTLLHYALLHRGTHESTLLTVLEIMTDACRVKMQPQDELPLHLAARHGASVTVITRLCEIYGAACQQRNAKHELPLHLAVRSATASEETVHVLLHYCPFVLADPSERRGLRVLVEAANVACPRPGVLRALLDHTPRQPIAANATKRLVTPLYAIALRKCTDPALATSGVLDELDAKFEEIEDEDAYFTALAKASRRRRHHCPTAGWPFPKILDLMERNPVDEAIIQRAMLALKDKLTQMQRGDESTRPNHDTSDALGVIVESVTLNSDWMLVRRVHQTMYELPWNARVQLLGHQILAKLLPTAFAKAAYKSRVDPYFNL